MGGEIIGVLELVEPAFKRDLSDASALKDAFDLCQLVEHVDFNLAHEKNRVVYNLAGKYAREQNSSAMFELYEQSMLFEAPHDFDFFMLALERKRPIKERFWMPRRKKLMHVCKDLQDLHDDKLDELFLSAPPRVGKTAIVQMFLLWMMGKDTEKSNLYCSFSGKPVDTFYNGLLEVLKDPDTYAYNDIFPGVTIAATNALDGIVDLNRKKKYPSFTGRPIGGSLNGSCDCNGLIIGDDLCEGIETASSPLRLASLWAKVDNNLLTRAKEGCKRLWIGTRWSLCDPEGVRIDVLQNEDAFKNVRWRIRNTPALDENEQSNFDYDYGVGFSTEYFLMRRASFERNGDMASWLAQYQGEPIEREGAVFDPSEMRYYNGVLPEGEPDRRMLICDPAFGGNDYVAAFVGYQYGDDIFVPDVVYNNGDKTVTQPLLVSAIERYKVTVAKIEGTKTTAQYGQDVDNMLRQKNIRINMQINTSHWGIQGKRDRIIAAAPDIKTHFVFLQEGLRSKEYSQFMQNVYSFTFVMAKNKHDDAADCLSMGVDFAFRGATTAVAMRSPFRR